MCRLPTRARHVRAARRALLDPIRQTVLGGAFSPPTFLATARPRAPRKEGREGARGAHRRASRSAWQRPLTIDRRADRRSSPERPSRTRRSCDFHARERKGTLTRSLRFAFTITGSFMSIRYGQKKPLGSGNKREKSNGKNSKTQDGKVAAETRDAETRDAQTRDAQKPSARRNAARRVGQAHRRTQGAAPGVVAGKSHCRMFAAGGSQLCLRPKRLCSPRRAKT